MQDLINELQQPRLITPAPAAIRASKALVELFQLQQADLQARKQAEQKLQALEAENIRLREELNELKNSNSSTTPSDTTNS